MVFVLVDNAQVSLAVQHTTHVVQVRLANLNIVDALAGVPVVGRASQHLFPRDLWRQRRAKGQRVQFLNLCGEHWHRRRWSAWWPAKFDLRQTVLHKVVHVDFKTAVGKLSNPPSGEQDAVGILAQRLGFASLHQSFQCLHTLDMFFIAKLQ